MGSGLAQHRGGGQQQSHGQPGGQQGMPGQSQPGQDQQMHTPQQLRIHASTQQQQQFRTCTKATEKFRNRIRKMARISTGKPIEPAEAKEWREQVRAELQAMTEEQTQFEQGLSEEQKTAVQENTKEVQMSREQLEQLSEDLDMELALENPDAAKVKATAREMEMAVNRIRSQQQKIANELGTY
jgi:hypothetical protein